MPSKYSKEQKEGLARFIDTIAASAFIGGVGLTGHSPLSTWDVSRYLVCDMSYTTLAVVEIEKAHMIITALVIFVIAAVGVTWYVTTH